jgi:hypothetical protein
MNLLQLKQIVDKALEEQPELGKTEVRFVEETGSSFIGALRLTEEEEGGYMYLALIPKIDKRVTLWESSL